MRGKNRIGWGLGASGIGFTIFFGVPALAGGPVEGWGLLALTFGAIGLVLILWGLVVYIVDTVGVRRVEKVERAEHRVQLDAKLRDLDAEIGVNEHWYMVAADYGDSLRASSLEAILAKLRADRASCQRKLEELE